MLSISTSWNSNADTNWQEWLTQIKDLGLNSIELSYTLSDTQLKSIEALIKTMHISVSSIHNFCPIPNDEPSPRHVSNYYRLSSLDDRERAQAIKWTKICIDTAVRVGAKVVVIHAGTLELADDPSIVLIKLFKEGKKDSDEFKQARERLIAVREAHRAPYIKALEKSLFEVVNYAKQKEIKIGLETRYYPIEMPNYDEIDYFLNLFGSYGMYYWHDVGHAQMQQKLGLAQHKDFLSRYKDRMIGVHLHGMKEARDHLAPFDGDLDLTEILPLLKDNIYRVIEARYATLEQIKTAVDKLSTRK